MTDSSKLQPILDRIEAGKSLTKQELQALVAAVRSKQVTFATGDQAVAIGGNADGAVILTGDGNHLQINGTDVQTLKESIQLSLNEHEQTSEANIIPKQRWDLITTILPPTLALPSVSFSFATVAIGGSGKELRREQGVAQQCIEDLGQGVNLEMVKISGGAFLMGSPASEIGHLQQEAPQHQVEIADFWMSKFPITQNQWKAIANLPLVNRAIKASPSKFKGDRHPVESVSWYDAVECCNRLIRYTGKPYRLPREAEWEYACRAGTATPFHFGEILTLDVANYGNNSNKNSKNSHRTTAVGEYQVANSFGLYDMHGNVWEWCSDWWRQNYKHLKIAPDESPENNPRVTRGGSWFDILNSCRSASRMDDNPEIPAATIGFRVVFSFP
jgi:formylglycine-generating enzyme required for sulfatase activity